MKLWIKVLFLFTILSGSVLDAQSKQIISPSNANIQYIGRIDFSNPEKPLFAYPNVTIKAKFQGTSIDLILKNYNGSVYTENYFVVIIDKGTPVKFSVNANQQLYSLASGLVDGVHTVELIKVTESYGGECEFIGFQIDFGKILLAPDPLPDLKLEFFGNSITCGYGIEGGAQPASDNSYKSYAAVAARQLNAQLVTTSYSGIGVVMGFPTFLMKDMYNRTIALTDYKPFPSNNTWNFNKYIPDVVIVALGTNDNTKGALSNVENFKSGYKNLISLIRAVYKNAQIVCTNSPMVSTTTLGTAISQVVADIKASGDSKITYFTFSLKKGGGFNGHPGVADGQTNGLELAAFLKGLLPVSSVDEVGITSNNFLVYPNPAKTAITIEGENIGFISVYTIDGNLVLQQRTKSTVIKMDISALKSGVYIIKIPKRIGFLTRRFVKI